MGKKITFFVTAGIIILIITVILGFIIIPEIMTNPYLRKAKALFCDYDIPEAFSCAAEGIQTYPDNEYLRSLLIKIVNVTFYLAYPYYYDFSNHRDVIETIEKYGDSGNAALVSEIGCYYWLKNERQKAKRYFEQAIELDPDYYPPYNYLGNYYYQSDFTRAIHYYQRLFALKPETLDFLGITVIDDYINRHILKNINVKTLFLTNPDTTILHNIGTFKRLEFLQLTGHTITDGYTDYIRNAQNLKALSLLLNTITRIEAFKGLDNLKILTINDNKISNIEHCSSLDNLKVLDLRGNEITRIENFDELPQLQHLYLSHNRITRIENLDALTNLRHLDLYNNQISRLENLDRLINLEILNLYFNRISKLENLDALRSLRHFYLRGNTIARLENLEKLTNLETLDLYENRVTRLENMDTLTNLGKLVLCSNEINRIENLDGLKNLQELDLRMNKITAIENLDALTNLRILYLSFNGIERIENLDALKNLQTLYMSVTQIGKIEHLDSLTSLQHLYLGGAHIKKIENLDALTGLTFLYLSNNEIPTIENLSSLTNLKTFNLGTNLISRIENLEELKHLQTLDLYANRINRLENLDQLKELQYLYLGNNQIGMNGETVLEIPSTLSSLKELIIGGPAYMNPGNIQHIRGIEHLKKIEKLEISYQNLIELPDFSSLTSLRSLHIEKCVNLKTIDFEKFPSSITSLVLWNVNLKNLDGIQRLVNLETLWVGDNPGLIRLSGCNELKQLKELNIGLCENLSAEELMKLLTIDTLIIALEQYPPHVIEALNKKGINVKMY
jgi:Leucine-rich repeat (LRR) protein